MDTGVASLEEVRHTEKGDVEKAAPLPWGQTNTQVASQSLGILAPPRPPGHTPLSTGSSPRAYLAIYFW